jgi:LysR family transcriptional regulator for metE and metH
MTVDLRDLELLDALADSGTLTAAAGRLFVSQPALSQRLTRLEEKLGVRLFEREGRRLVPNPAGHRMLATSRHVLSELRAAERAVREIRDGRDRQVRFAAQCSTTFHWLPPIVRAFRAQQPGADVRIEMVSDDEPIPALLDDLVDVALVIKPDRRMDQVELTPLFADEMVAVVAASHPWAQRHHVTARDFDDVHMILYDAYDQTRIPARLLPIPHGARPGRITTMPVITELLIEMVAGGEGVGILPSWIAAPYVEGHDVRLVRVGAKGQARHWYCATRAGRQPEHIAEFAGLLVERLRQP